jgi:hypothetical protein
MIGVQQIDRVVEVVEEALKVFVGHLDQSLRSLACWILRRKGNTPFLANDAPYIRVWGSLTDGRGEGDDF